MKKIVWTNQKIALKNLIEYEKNPVQISEREAKELSKSLDKFEHVIPYVAAAPITQGKPVPLLDGHQRKMVELSLNKVSPNTLVDVRVPNRELTEKEVKEIAIRLRKNTGEFDNDALLNWFDADELLDFGFSENELEEIGFDIDYNGKPKLDEKSQTIQEKKLLHILISVDLSKEIESVFAVKEAVAEIEKMNGVEVIYGGN